METTQSEKKYLEAGIHEDYAPRPSNETEIQREASSSSSSSSDSEGDFFQLDPSELNKLMTGNDEMPPNKSVSQLGENTELELKAAKQMSNGDENMLAGLAQSGQVTIGTPSSQSVPFHSSALENSSALGVKQSPPIQHMGTYDVPDPNRIPASIFRTKSTTPMEWSVTSNESLFSICMGKSGDLSTIYNNQLDGSPAISPLGNAGPIAPLGNAGSFSPLGNAGVEKALEPQDVPRAATEENADKGKPTDEGVCDSTSHSSFGSYRSFAFPILTGEGKNGSIKVESMHELPPKQHEQQPQPQKEPPNPAPVAAGSSWFSCFSCCSYCC